MKMQRENGTLLEELLNKRDELQRSFDQWVQEFKDRTRGIGMRAATAEGEDDSTIEAMQVTSDTLRTMDKAIERAESGKYDECSRCGKTIDKERLDALLAVTTCIKCAREEEKNSREGRGTSRGNWGQVADEEVLERDLYTDLTAEALKHLKAERG